MDRVGWCTYSSDVREHHAWGDESFDEAAEGGVYVVCAATFEADLDLDHVRDVMLGLRKRRQWGKLHWSEMDDTERRKATEEVAAFGGLHVVAVATPVPHKRQERARAACLTALVGELHGLNVIRLCMESRTAALDKRDVDIVRAARQRLPKGMTLHVEHKRGVDEPLLWVADIVAGACRSHRQGVEVEYREALGDVVYDLEIDSGC